MRVSLKPSHYTFSLLDSLNSPDYYRVSCAIETDLQFGVQIQVVCLVQDSVVAVIHSRFPSRFPFNQSLLI